jgi:hypothetical protein
MRGSCSSRAACRRCVILASAPQLSSLWIGLATPVDAGVARPLVEGLRTPTVETDPSGAGLFDVTPDPLEEALERALSEEERQPRNGNQALRGGERCSAEPP